MKKAVNKLTLEKIQVTRFTNLIAIKGGIMPLNGGGDDDDDDDRTTDTQRGRQNRH